VSNAVVNPTFSPEVDCPEDAWDKIFDVNMKAPFLLTRGALPLLSRRKNGPNVVYVTSIVTDSGMNLMTLNRPNLFSYKQFYVGG
jgi:NAD(P)-dependent dehydrogenase (short-subunit alcohol dehydrogenase family)